MRFRPQIDPLESRLAPSTAHPDLHALTAAITGSLAPTVVPAYARHVLRPALIATYGNSITSGYGLPSPATQRYPSLLQGDLGTGYTVSNQGRIGGTGELIATIAAAQSSPKALGFAGGIAIFWEGTNTLANATVAHHTPSQLKDLAIGALKAMRTFVDDAHAKGESVIVMTCAYASGPSIANPVEFNYARAWYNTYVMATTGMGADAVVAVDLDPRLAGHLQGDGVHLDPTGEQAVEQDVLPVVRMLSS